MQTTLIIIKPDAIQRGLAGRIISRIEDKGLKIIGAKMMHMSAELGSKHYAVHKGKPFYNDLLKFMTSSPVMVLAVHGKRVIDTMRQMMGKTTAYQADPGTIRGDFGSSQSYNLIHGSDSEESAKKEIELFFTAEELHPFKRVIEQWIHETTGGEAE